MFPKRGNVFLRVRSVTQSRSNYAESIAHALRKELGERHQAIKVAMSWTGANERTVKNWLAGTNGPTGEHLLSLIKHSDLVFATLLELSGREQSIAIDKLTAARDALDEVLAVARTKAEVRGYLDPELAPPKCSNKCC